jgi:hypothetical protein
VCRGDEQGCEERYDREKHFSRILHAGSFSFYSNSSQVYRVGGLLSLMAEKLFSNSAGYRGEGDSTLWWFEGKLRDRTEPWIEGPL